MKYLIHSLEYLRANFYEDEDGDFWESEKAQVKWARLTLQDASTIPMEWIYPHEVGVGITTSLDRNIMWAVAEILTIEKNPEYYL